MEIVGSIRGPRGSKKVQAQGELEGEVNNQQMEKLDSRCITATASHSGHRVCKVSGRSYSVALSELLGWGCLLLGQSHCVSTQSSCHSQGCSMLARATPFELRAALVRAAWSGLLVAGSELLGRSSVDRATQLYIFSRSC